MSKIITDSRQIDEILNRGTIVETLPTPKEFHKKLLSGEKLRFYIGADPTAKALHLGHAQNLMILEDFRRLGHEVIFLIGDFTGMIGDPTDKSAARVRQTREGVENNFRGWVEQVKNILSFDDKSNPVKIKYNSEWLAKLNFEQVINLASNFTVQQMLERDMFEKRITTTWLECKTCKNLFKSPIQFSNQKSFKFTNLVGNTTICPKCGEKTCIEKNDIILKKELLPIYLHEFLYPLMQGYDSVAMDVDVELCGSDQIFNALAGRTLMQKLKNKNKFVIATKLIADEKTGMLMSKSNGTGVFLDLNPNDLFGAIMSQPDGMIKPLLLGCTRIPLSEIKELMNLDNPRDTKAKLAHEIVAIYHDEKEAKIAEKEFNKIFRDKNKPTDIPEIKLAKKEYNLLNLLSATKMASSKSDARRLVQQGGVKIDDVVQKDFEKEIKIKNEMIVQVGKRRFVKIIL
ncbi:tyrosine--tRNA ligase [Patescibacteria group bacterium]|nr:tyrosine--tRNA ligase [Patescibacteria group bacterium]